MADSLLNINACFINPKPRMNSNQKQTIFQKEKLPVPTAQLFQCNYILVGLILRKNLMLFRRQVQLPGRIDHPQNMGDWLKVES